MVVQKILRLQVSVGDSQAVQVYQCSQYHLDGLGSISLSEVAPADNTVQKFPSCRQFQYHVNTLWKLEHLNQLNDISMAHPLQHC